jgi:hypothetical protein
VQVERLLDSVVAFLVAALLHPILLTLAISTRLLQVERLLDSVDAVIYILDYTKLKTQEEADLLAKLKARPCFTSCQKAAQFSSASIK